MTNQENSQAPVPANPTAASFSLVKTPTAFDISNQTSFEDTRLVATEHLVDLMDGCGLRNLPDVQQVIAARYGFGYDQTAHSVPFRQYLAIAEYLRTRFHPDKTFEAGYEILGYQQSKSYLNRSVGLVLKTLASVIGPQRGAKQFVRTLQTNMPWATHTLVEVSSNFGSYRGQGLGQPPGLMVGSIRAAMEVTGVKDVSCTYTVLNAEQDITLFETTWR